MPDIFFTKSDMVFGLSTNFSLKKIKNSPTIKAKIEKNKTKAGVFIFTAVNMKTPALVLFFSIFAFMVGLFFIFLREKLVDNPKTISDFVKKISGITIGFISVPLGIGGGSLMVPFMRTFGYDIRKSIGTAAAVGLSLIHI